MVTLDQEQDCIGGGTAMPKVERAEVIHPGDRKKQVLSIEVKYQPMPAECTGSFQRVGWARFQLQDPFNHQRWFNVGPFHKFLSEDGSDGGGEARVFEVPRVEISSPRFVYRCTPGPGKTHARAVLRQEVKDTESGQLAGRKLAMRSLRVKRVPFKLDAEQRRRGAVQGAC